MAQPEKFHDRMAVEMWRTKGNERQMMRKGDEYTLPPLCTSFNDNSYWINK